MLALSWFIYKCQSPFWEMFKLLVIWWNHLGNILFNMPYSTKPLFFSSLKVCKYTCFVNISKGGMINLDSPICQVYLLRLFRKDRVVWTLYPINTLLDVNVMFLEKWWHTIFFWVGCINICVYSTSNATCTWDSRKNTSYHGTMGNKLQTQQIISGSLKQARDPNLTVSSTFTGQRTIALGSFRNAVGRLVQSICQIQRRIVWTQWKHRNTFRNCRYVPFNHYFNHVLSGSMFTSKVGKVNIWGNFA